MVSLLLSIFITIIIIILIGVKRIGISNCYDLNLFKKIVENSEIKPSFLQNRCDNNHYHHYYCHYHHHYRLLYRFYKDTDYDVDLRKYCQENNVIYQSFWTLTANPHIGICYSYF